MPLISDARKIMVGGKGVRAVYAGSQKVWPSDDLQPKDTQIVCHYDNETTEETIEGYRTTRPVVALSGDLLVRDDSIGFDGLNFNGPIIPNYANPPRTCSAVTPPYGSSLNGGQEYYFWNLTFKDDPTIQVKPNWTIEFFLFVNYELYRIGPYVTFYYARTLPNVDFYVVEMNSVGNGSSALKLDVSNFGYDNNSFRESALINVNSANGYWHHYALTMESDTTNSTVQFKTYVDGILQAEITAPKTFTNKTTGLQSTNGYCGGYDIRNPNATRFFDELRITNGLVYTGNFTPPTQDFDPPDPVLLK